MLKKYKVRIEINTTGCDLANIEVSAVSKEEATIEAIKLYNSDNPPDLDYWASDYTTNSLAEETASDWEVEELPNA